MFKKYRLESDSYQQTKFEELEAHGNAAVKEEASSVHGEPLEKKVCGFKPILVEHGEDGQFGENLEIHKKIEVISTVAWNFLKLGLPNGQW